MKDTKDVTALCLDYGLFTETAARLGRDFKKVYYYVPQEASYPQPYPAHVGYGIEGIELVDSPFGPWYKDVDVFIFTELGFSQLQTFLEAQGKCVWGARQAEELESNRAGMKRLLKKLGMPVNELHEVKGLDALREYLKYNKNQWVKINRWRGVGETFFAKEYKLVEAKLDEMRHKLGPLAKLMSFVCEENLPDRIEAAIDGFTVDGKYPKKILTGIEVKDKSFAGRVMDFDKIPDPITRFDKAIAPVLGRYGYRGFYGTEVRIGPDKKPYMIDFCARSGSPPGELWSEMYTNLGDIVWHGANGEIVDPVIKDEWGVQVFIESQWSDQNWQAIYFPEKYRRNIKLRNPCKVDGCYYIIPQNMGLTSFGTILGMGKTLEAATKQAKEIAENVEGDQIDITATEIDEAIDQLKKMKEFGMDILT
jgi:phosphoribosylamine-glycine ligase